MKKQIVNVSILQNAKVMAALYFFISLPMALITMIPMMSQGRAGFSLMMLVLMPVLYTLVGFVFTLIGAWVYNLIASRVGGFEFTTSEVGKE